MVYSPRNLSSESLNMMRDIKDSPILVTAIIENVDIFITGDKDFKYISIERPEILTASEFLEKY